VRSLTREEIFKCLDDAGDLDGQTEWLNLNIFNPVARTGILGQYLMEKRLHEYNTDTTRQINKYMELGEHEHEAIKLLEGLS
jgi:hypothetical protein